MKNKVRVDYKRLDYMQASHGVMNVLRLVCTSLLLAAWFYWAPHYLEMWVYALLSLPLCIIHQRELSEWIHEAAHFNLVPDKTWNDRLTLVFAGFFFANDIKAHRFGHNQHHRQKQFFVENDPDTRLFRLTSKQAFLQEVLRDLSGITALKMFTTRTGERCPSPTPHFFIKLVLFQSALLGTLLWLGRVEVYVLYYFTLVTLYPLLNRLRLYGQHVELGPNGEVALISGVSRTIDAGLWDRLFFTSDVMMYHYEHHAYPDLPYRALVKMPKAEGDENAFSRRRLSLIRDIYRRLP